MGPEMITAEILSTGNEVLWGDVDDTNANWLSRRLRESGIDVQRTSCIGDDVKDISEIMQEISTRVDIVLVTGGLGPTSDDLSAEAAAKASGDVIILNEHALTSMEAYFEKRGWPMSDGNKKQAMLPSNVGIMENSCGTAPGFYVKCGKAVFFFMPGVPTEMKAMYELSVLPQIRRDFDLNARFLMTRLKLFGLSESLVGSRLKEFHGRFPGLELGFRASFPLIEVKISTLISGDAFIHDATIHNSGTPENRGSGNSVKNLMDSSAKNLMDSSAKNPMDNSAKNPMDNSAKNFMDSSAKNRMDEAREWVTSLLGEYIISQDGLNMEQEVGRLMAKHGKTVAIAESCTGGLIASMLTDVSGSSDYFLMSAVTYSNGAKIRVLGVNPDTIADNGAVHELTAQEMASRVRNIAGADYGISTSGIAGPGGGSEEKPVGTVCIGIAGEGFVKSYQYRFSFTDRPMNKKIFAVKALDLLRRELLL